MSTKSLILLVLVTAAAVAAAIFAVNARATDVVGGAEGAAGTRGELLYPGLADRVNDASSLEISGAGGDPITIEREAGTASDTWGLASKGGYPVEFERIKQTVLTLSELEILERKTARPENFGRLGLLEPGSEGATSTRLILRDTSGAVLADLVVGNTRNADSLYVRRHGEDQTWLVKGSLELPKKPIEWVDTGVLQIDRQRFARAHVAHPDGEDLDLVRESKDSYSWIVEGLPEGRELKTASAPAPVGDALAYVALEDVRPADQVDFTNATVSTWQTFDGLQIEVRTARVDDVWWTHYTAAEVDPIEEPDAEPAEDEQGPPVVDPAAQEKEVDVTAEVAELNERLAPWAFAVSEYKATNYAKRLEDLLKPLPPPESGEAGDSGSAEATAPPAEQAPAVETAPVAGGAAGTSGSEN